METKYPLPAGVMPTAFCDLSLSKYSLTSAEVKLKVTSISTGATRPYLLIKLRIVSSFTSSFFSTNLPSVICFITCLNVS